MAEARCAGSATGTGISFTAEMHDHSRQIGKSVIFKRECVKGRGVAEIFSCGGVIFASKPSGNRDCLQNAARVAATRSIARRVQSRQLTLTFGISRSRHRSELGNGGRIQWISGLPGEVPAYAGTDFIIARDGRIAAIYLFFDKFFEK